MIENKVTLNMVVSDAMEAMKFYEEVFNGTRGEVYYFPNRTGENETNITIGNITLRLIDENKEYQCSPPKKGEIDSIWLQVQVEDTDAIMTRAKAYGAVIGQEPSEFMGVRHAEITDPFGYVWTINQILKEVSFEERYKFYEELHLEKDNEKK